MLSWRQDFIEARNQFLTARNAYRLELEDIKAKAIADYEEKKAEEAAKEVARLAEVAAAAKEAKKKK